MARFGSNLIAGLINPSFGGNLTALGEQIGSAQAVGRQRRMLTDLLAPLADPMATSVDYGRAARGLMGIDQKSALALASQGRDLAIKEAEAEQFRQRKAALQANATTLGFPDIANSVASITDSDELAEVGKELRKRVLDTTPTQTVPQRKFMSRSVGISEEQFNELDLGGISDQNFNALISGQGGELEPFLVTTADGKSTVVQKRINNGLVWDDEAQTWKTAEELGLQRPPPQVRLVEQINKILGTELVEEGVEIFAKQTEKVGELAQSLNSINRSLPLIDNMFTGSGAEMKLNFFRFGKLLGLDMAPVNSIADTETYMADAGVRVAGFIQNLGAGTGLSDADLKFSHRVEGGDITVDAEGLKRILQISKSRSEGVIQEYYERRGKIRDELTKTGEEAALLFYPNPVLNQPLGSAAPTAADTDTSAEDELEEIKRRNNLL